MVYELRVNGHAFIERMLTTLEVDRAGPGYFGSELTAGPYRMGVKVSEVAGHTDSSGDDAYNLDLSQRRAEAVRDYLISEGVNADMLGAHGYGEERSVESNATAAGRAENRRVELMRLDQ